MNQNLDKVYCPALIIIPSLLSDFLLPTVSFDMKVFVQIMHEIFVVYSLFTTTESVIWTREEDPWLPIDTVLMAIVLGLLGTLFVLIVAVIIHAVKSNKN